MTGTTRKIADAISKVFSCDMEEILDTKNRKGPLGFLASGRDASQKKLTSIQPVKKDPGLYDVVLIGTPVWAGTVSTPIRTYIFQNRERFNRVAFFCTYGGRHANETFKAMSDLCGKEAVASVAITTKETKGEEYLQKINEFVNTIKRISD
jgi:flavodoxin